MSSDLNISIVIPTFNRSFIIPKMLSSLMQQTFKEFEVIIIDDGSTDNTEKAIKPYMTEKVYYRRIQHRGTPYAWNLGVKLSRYNYVLFLGDDVYLHPMCIYNLIQSLNRVEKKDLGAIAPRLIYVSSFNYIEEKKSNKKYPYIDPCTGDIIGNFNIDTGDLIEVPIIHGYSLVRKESFIDVGGFDEKTYKGNYYREETDLWLRFKIKGYKLYYQPKAKIYCKKGIIPGGQLGNVGSNLLLYEYYVIKNHKNFLKKFYGKKRIFMFISFIIRRIYIRLNEIKNIQVEDVF